MNTSEIKTMLEKFYQGTTTLEEEKLLQKYFSSEHADTESFAVEKHLFGMLNLSENIEIPSDLTEKIITKIDSESSNIMFMSAIRFRKISIAACFALLFAIGATFLLKTEQPKFIANISTNETEIMEMLESSFSKISGVVDDAVTMLDITQEEVCELNEALGEL